MPLTYLKKAPGLPAQTKQETHQIVADMLEGLRGIVVEVQRSVPVLGSAADGLGVHPLLLMLVVNVVVVDGVEGDDDDGGGVGQSAVFLVLFLNVFMVVII